MSSNIEHTNLAPVSETVVIDDLEFTFETGRVARQANGAVLVTCGETVTLVTAVAAGKPREGVNFLPLSCDYVEKTYAAGKIPHSFFRREGRLSTDEILVCRLMDRPIRPLFSDGWRFETQIVALVLSADKVNDPAINAINGASMALSISDIPFDGPIAAVRVGQVDGKLVCNPTYEQRAAGDLDLVVCVGPNGITMVEGEADFIGEDTLVEALFFAQEKAQPFLDAQHRIREKVGREKRVVEEPQVDGDLLATVKAAAGDELLGAIRVAGKHERRNAISELKARVIADLGGDDEDRQALVKEYFGKVQKKAVRAMIAHDKVRIDGRGYEDVRAVSTEVGVLPRTHGSALFTRGETQAIVTVTLGTSQDEQRIDALVGESTKDFFLHYNFWPFCVGETRFLRGPGRREIGHGTLAERGLKRAINGEEFPYTIRIVSEITESNGSSSMATVCGGSLAMMQAGVPLHHPVAGIAMGLIKEDDEVAILTDILGDEDHLGDMDFKVIGSHEGVSGLQMDIKIDGVDRALLTRALDQARNARLHILDRMGSSLEASNEDIAPHAPRIYTVLIKPDRIRDLIGPGGKHIRGIQAETGTKIDVDDSGTVMVAAADEGTAKAAIEQIRSYTAEPEIGELYMGRCVKVTDFGAFIRILPNTDGLCHISELANRRVGKVEDVVREGDDVLVKVIGMDRGKIKLSRKAALAEQEGNAGDAEQANAG